MKRYLMTITLLKNSTLRVAIPLKIFEIGLMMRIKLPIGNDDPRLIILELISKNYPKNVLQVDAPMEEKRNCLSKQG